MLLVRKIRRVRVWSVPHSHAVQYAERESARHNIRVEVMESAQQAVRGADLICTCTPSRDPVLLGEWVAQGAHINAMGASVPTSRELDTEAVVRSRLYVDRRESATNEAGEFLFPRREGAITEAHIQGEIGEILAGKVKGRGSPDEITLFKSLGLAVEDVASAAFVWRRAIEQGVGLEVEIGGQRPDLSPRPDLP
jgi:ornithine cyclodeaminase